MTSKAAKVDVIPAHNTGYGSDRVALVMGNGDYANIADLTNTLNDAEAIAQSLQRVGFEVFLARNMTRLEMNDAIERFLAAVKPGAEALIYYAGHGVELDGQNYLLPTDIRNLEPGQRRSLRAESISLNLLLEDLRDRRARVNLVLLDACRDNPFPTDDTRSLGRSAGLGRVDPPHGTVVVYAAAAGEKALDRLSDADTNPNGLFTRHLLDLIEQPGLEIRSLVQELKERVYNDARKVSLRFQRPSYYDGLIGKFYFRPKARPLALQHPCEILVDPNADVDAVRVNDYASAVPLCQRAVATYPDEARFRILLAAAEEQWAAQRALGDGGEKAAKVYAARFPDGHYRTVIDARFAPPASEEAGTTVQPQIQEPAPEPKERTFAPTQTALLTKTEPEAGLEPQPQPESEAAETEPAPAPVPVLSGRELSRTLQTELNRLGCSAGRPDGIWGRNSARAMRSYAKHSKRQLASLEPSVELLDILKDETARVCPLVCSVRQTVRNGRCVAKTCPAGQKLSSKGNCYVPKKRSVNACKRGQKRNSKGVCYTPRTASTSRPARTSTTRRPAASAPAKASKPERKGRLDGYTGWSKCPALANGSC